ncbi:MAG: GDSL-type esterase/lipase family protein [Planctomycetota bacterium]|nr:GDSL-type esterase/lipase family protein [Planctomycetota bacterium]
MAVLRRILGRLAAVLVSGCLAALALELYLRLASPADEGYRVWPPHLQATFHPQPEIMPGVEGPSHFRVNARGLRGAEAPDAGGAPVHRVLCVGGSTTECLYLDQEESWPGLLQILLISGLSAELSAGSEDLAVHVENAGVSGRTTRDHVVMLRRLLPELGPFDRVILLAGVNDLMLPLTRQADYDPRFLEQPGAEAELLPRAFAVLPWRHRPELPWTKRTELWRRFAPPLKRLLGVGSFQDSKGEVVVQWRRHRRAAARLRDELPDLTAALDEYRRNLITLIELCEPTGARVLVVTQPCLWRDDLPPELVDACWMGGVGDYQNAPGAEYYSIPALARGMQLYNDVALDVARERGLDVLDLVPLVPRDGTSFYDDVHFTENGARIVAEAIAEVLLAAPPLGG